jgi:hypothetical protein
MAAADGLFMSSLGRWRTASITIHGKNCHARKTTKIHFFHAYSRFFTRALVMPFEGSVECYRLTKAYGVRIDDAHTDRLSGDEVR